ncbi:hypothetical protein HK100_005413 [Physocladia obscura]|uniref:Receptor ligand binding region domain-containing protein n=1 Tax=Physocladia obscura TaxID=109957 RepID=A0AAD5SRR2_9FUNG|nr:hypothetical protein HK100_005413 [Physocladia obscura]
MRFSLAAIVTFAVEFTRATVTEKATNISLGSIAIYCAVPNLITTRSIVTNFSTTYDPNFINYNGWSGFTFFNELAILLAVDEINNSSTILPNIHVNVKRFSTCGSYDASYDSDYSGFGVGFAGAVMVQDVLQQNDLIALVGSEYSSTAIYHIARIFQPRQLLIIETFTIIFGACFRMKSGKFLKQLKVRQVSVIYESTSQLASPTLLQVLQQNGVNIAAKVSLVSQVDQTDFNYVASVLKQTTSRYFVLLGGVISVRLCI